MRAAAFRNAQLARPVKEPYRPSEAREEILGSLYVAGPARNQHLRTPGICGALSTAGPREQAFRVTAWEWAPDSETRHTQQYIGYDARWSAAFSGRLPSGTLRIRGNSCVAWITTSVRFPSPSPCNYPLHPRCSPLRLADNSMARPFPGEVRFFSIAPTPAPRLSSCGHQPSWPPSSFSSTHPAPRGSPRPALLTKTQKFGEVTVPHPSNWGTAKPARRSACPPLAGLWWETSIMSPPEPATSLMIITFVP